MSKSTNNKSSLSQRVSNCEVLWGMEERLDKLNHRIELVKNYINYVVVGDVKAHITDGHDFNLDKMMYAMKETKNHMAEIDAWHTLDYYTSKDKKNLERIMGSWKPTNGHGIIPLYVVPEIEYLESMRARLGNAIKLFTDIVNGEMIIENTAQEWYDSLSANEMIDTLTRNGFDPFNGKTATESQQIVDMYHAEKKLGNVKENK